MYILTLLSSSALSLPLSFFSLSRGWNTLGHKTPICPTGHVATLNQKPGEGHMAAKSIVAKPEAKLFTVKPNSDTVQATHKHVLVLAFNAL